jgi:DNA-binding GntR family transcriptional regulator
MKILYNIDAENVDKALDSLVEEGLVEVKKDVGK